MGKAIANIAECIVTMRTEADTSSRNRVREHLGYFNDAVTDRDANGIVFWRGVIKRDIDWRRRIVIADKALNGRTYDIGKKIEKMMEEE